MREWHDNLLHSIDAEAADQQADTLRRTMMKLKKCVPRTLTARRCCMLAGRGGEYPSGEGSLLLERAWTRRKRPSEWMGVALSVKDARVVGRPRGWTDGRTDGRVDRWMSWMGGWFVTGTSKRTTCPRR